jgi:hypothetical protein
MPTELLTQRETAAFLRVTRSFLATTKNGPPFIRIGRAIRYEKTELLKWLDARRVKPVSA